MNPPPCLVWIPFSWHNAPRNPLHGWCQLSQGSGSEGARVTRVQFYQIVTKRKRVIQSGLRGSPKPTCIPTVSCLSKLQVSM